MGSGGSCIGDLAVGCAALWRRSRFVVLTGPLYLGLLLIWPSRARRLLAPLLPFLALAVFSGFRALLGISSPRRFVRTAVLSTALVWGTWFGLRSIGGLFRGEHHASSRVRSAALLRAVEAVQRATPPEAVVGAPELWAAIHLYTGRTVAPSARFAPVSSDGRPWGTPQARFPLWQEAGLDYLVVEHGGAVRKASLDGLDELCPGAIRLVAAMTGAALVRLDWDGECRRRILGPQGATRPAMVTSPTQACRTRQAPLLPEAPARPESTGTRELSGRGDRAHSG